MLSLHHNDKTSESMSKLYSDHNVCVLTKNDTEIVLLGETHFKESTTYDLCNRIITKFQCIGYENCKYPAGIISYLVGKIISYFYDRKSSILSKKILLGFLREKFIDLEDNSSYEIIDDNGEKISFQGKELNNNIRVIDLEKQDKLSFRQYIMGYYYDYAIIFLWTVSCFMLTGIKIPIPLIVTVYMLSIYQIIEFFSNWMFSNRSYQFKSKINYVFPIWDFLYRRDKIMADNINEYATNNSQKMLAICGKNHLEGIKYYLTKNHEFNMQYEMTLEDYIAKIEVESLKV
jgi:hypothetical protein